MRCSHCITNSRFCDSQVSASASFFVKPVDSSRRLIHWPKALDKRVNAWLTVAGNWAYSAASLSFWPINALTTTSAVSRPSSASLRSRPIGTFSPSAKACARRGLFSTTELNSSPRSTPDARAWPNCSRDDCASAAEAPEMRSACEMLSVRVSASFCSPPSIRTACCSFPYSVAVSWIGMPIRWAMSKSSFWATAYSRWPAVASLRRADIMFQASAIWTISCTLPLAQLMVRKASSCVLARLICSPKAETPALTSAIPADAFWPAVLALPESSPSDFSAESTARLSPSSAPSRATRTEMRLAIAQSTRRSCFSMAAASRGTRPATRRSTFKRFLSCTRGTSTAIGMSAPRFNFLIPSALR